MGVGDTTVNKGQFMERDSKYNIMFGAGEKKVRRERGMGDGNRAARKDYAG